MAAERQPFVVSVPHSELDLAVAEDFARLLEPASDACSIVIDLSRVTFIDSSCLANLAVLRRKRRALAGAGEGTLVVTSPSVRKVLNLVGFDRQWNVCGSIEEALDDNDPLERAEGS